MRQIFTSWQLVWSSAIYVCLELSDETLSYIKRKNASFLSKDDFIKTTTSFLFSFFRFLTSFLKARKFCEIIFKEFFVIKNIILQSDYNFLKFSKYLSWMTNFQEFFHFLWMFIHLLNSSNLNHCFSYNSYHNPRKRFFPFYFSFHFSFGDSSTHKFVIR